eukprot:g1805.t1
MTRQSSRATTAGIPLFAPEAPFSRPLRVTPHATANGGGLVREVFGHLHLRGGGGLSRRLEGLPHVLDMARLYLSIHDIGRAATLFSRIVKLCRAASPGEGYRDSGVRAVAQRPSSTSAQPGFDPFVYASACVGLARVHIARLRGNGQGQIGRDAHNSDGDAWLALPRATEEAVKLLNRGIRAASEASVPAEHLFLGEALGCLGELLEVLPDLLGPDDTTAAGESCAQMRERISESFVAAIALCAGGIRGHEQVMKRNQLQDPSTKSGENSGGALNPCMLLLRDPQKNSSEWCENAVVDMVRIQGAAARCVSPGQRAYRFQGLAEEVAKLAVEKFGAESTVVAQALHDLGRVGVKAQSASGAHPRDAWDFIEAARQAYSNCGTWSGSTEIVQCLGTLVKASRNAGHLSEGAHDMARSAVRAHLRELQMYPDSQVAAQSLARSVGTFGDAACQSGDVLGAVELEFQAKESMLCDGRNRCGQNVAESAARRDGISRKQVCHRTGAQEELLRRSAGVWARTPRLPRSNPYPIPRAPAVVEVEGEDGADGVRFVEHLQPKLPPRQKTGFSGRGTAPWSP